MNVGMAAREAYEENRPVVFVSKGRAITVYPNGRVTSVPYAG